MTGEYLRGEDPIARWLEERCVREPDAFTLTQDLFEDWQEWCAENGERPSLTKIAFSRQVAERGMERGEEKTGRRGFRGIRVAARLVM